MQRAADCPRSNRQRDAHPDPQRLLGVNGCPTLRQLQIQLEPDGPKAAMLKTDSGLGQEERNNESNGGETRDDRLKVDQPRPKEERAQMSFE